jgi:NAD(P)H-quinone oxidoreductase subunit 5
MEQLLYRYAWLIPVLPLISSLVMGIGLISFRQATQSLRRDLAFFTISLLGISVLYSFGIFYFQFVGGSPYKYLVEWVVNRDFSLELGYFIDPLSSVMLIVVSTVAFLVMIYTDGYMAYDAGYVRFFSYLSLFTSSMLALVLSPNLTQVYIFWELIGMCSYLLIGFWFTRSTAGDACQKAFVTNRVGDFGLLLGILGFYWLTKSFEFSEISLRLKALLDANAIPVELGILFSLLVFMGPISKSAQFPLHVWLPDAMEGPTPISALIHAATLVAAGVFLTGRMFPVFEQFDAVMNFIAWTGATTAFLGATTAITQVDLKKALAYSTVSQLGYMMMALGVGAYSAGLFHLITHAYSKALLFLGSGSVIHGVEGVLGFNPARNQDMNLMGGLRKKMPITSFTFLIGTLSICGFPPFACFWSKDEILADLFNHNIYLWFIAWFTAGLTSFYMFRIYFLTFEGNFRGYIPEANLKAQVKESPTAMVLPLVILTIPTVFIGFAGTPFHNYFSEFVEGAYTQELDWVEFLTMAGSSVGIGFVGFTLAFLTYYKSTLNSQKFANENQGLYNLSRNKWYFDEIYGALFVNGNRALAKQILLFDQYFVDGIVNLTGLAVFFTGESLRYIETGRFQFYGVTILFALVSLFYWSSVSPLFSFF